MHGARSETWRRIARSLRQGQRGLPAGSSLRGLLAEHRGVRNPTLLPDLSTDQILAWADAHRAATGNWPSSSTGLVRQAPFTVTWNAISVALSRGFRGLPGGQSLGRLLREHRPPGPGISKDNTRAQVQKSGRRPAAPPEGIPALSVEQILAWADAHHAATGRWPSQCSGPIRGVPGETWGEIHKALKYGRRGLPGSTTLIGMLVQHRRRPPRNGPPLLTVEQILGWADAYHETHGRWPDRVSGLVKGSSTETWRNIDTALCRGWRDLPGGSSIARLLEQHRGIRAPNNRSALTIALILNWADRHHKKHGHWPSELSGPVAGAPWENWKIISQALRSGRRGLPAGSSLCRLLAEQRGVRRPSSLPDLSLDQILAWADAYHAATRKWPTQEAGSVGGVRGEKWTMIDHALRKGTRGLQGASSLASLLAEHRPKRRRALTLETILAWGEAHRAATGRWPDYNSGAIAGAPKENWSNINSALRSGHRGLPSRMSLAKLFAGRRAPANRNHGGR